MSDIDETRLLDWLQASIGGFAGPIRLNKFPGGQSNPTYRIDSASGAYVLRRKPFGTLLPSAHAVEREYRLISALHPAGFPVPRPIALCERTDIIGATFYLMEFVAGRNIPDPILEEIPRADRRAHYRAMVETLAQLHSLDHEALGLGDFGRPGNYFGRQVERWIKQYRGSETSRIPAVEKLVDWLPSTVPEQSASAIIHGDYRIDNLIFEPSSPQVAAVIDWELATIGDPLADFAYLAMNWILPADGTAGLAGVDLEQEALPDIEELAALYCAASGRARLPDLHWYFAFSLFRLTAIIQGVKKRQLDGNASSARAQAVIDRIEPLAQAAWAEARKAGAD